MEDHDKLVWLNEWHQHLTEEYKQEIEKIGSSPDNIARLQKSQSYIAAQILILRSKLKKHANDADQSNLT